MSTQSSLGAPKWWKRKILAKLSPKVGSCSALPWIPSSHKANDTPFPKFNFPT